MTAWLAAGLPEEVPGVTVDRQCGSSQQAVQFAAALVGSGMADLVIAGGVQNMSQIPLGSAMTVGAQFGFPTPFTGSGGAISVRSPRSTRAALLARSPHHRATRLD